MVKFYPSVIQIRSLKFTAEIQPQKQEDNMENNTELLNVTAKVQ